MQTIRILRAVGTAIPLTGLYICKWQIWIFQPLTIVVSTLCVSMTKNYGYVQANILIQHFARSRLSMLAVCREIILRWLLTKGTKHANAVTWCFWPCTFLSLQAGVSRFIPWRFKETDRSFILIRPKMEMSSWWRIQKRSSFTSTTLKLQSSLAIRSCLRSVTPCKCHTFAPAPIHSTHMYVISIQHNHRTFV